MPTKIYTTNILVNGTYRIDGWPLKKLPTEILIKHERLIEFIEHRLEEKGIKMRDKNGRSKIKTIKIEWIKFCGHVNIETYRNHEECQFLQA